MKTAKYEMYINTMETLGEAIPLSKKEFQRQIKYYKDVIAENHARFKEVIEKLKVRYPANWQYDDIEHCLDDIAVHTEDHERYTETIYAVHDDGAAIVFREKVCKPGYYWK